MASCIPFCKFVTLYLEINEVTNDADFTKAFLLSDCHTLYTRRLNAILLIPIKIAVFSAPIFTKWTFAGQRFLKNTYTEFNGNPTNGLVADTRSRTDRQTLSLRNASKMSSVRYQNRSFKISLHCVSNCDLFGEMMRFCADDMSVHTGIQTG
jgi:hypothetical protein